MKKFTGKSIEEFIKWVTENWKEIEAAYEACEKYLEEQKENLTGYCDVKDIVVGIPNNFNIVSNKDTLYVLPVEPKPIKICFVGDSLGEVDIIDKV